MPKQKSKYAIDECTLKDVLKQLPKNRILADKSKIFHALSEPIRMKILSVLSLRPLCVCVLTEITKMKYSKLSYHLSILKENNLITCKEDGNWLIYRLTPFGKRMVKIVRTKIYISDSSSKTKILI
jgi:ArsR family transcriptional regulator